MCIGGENKKELLHGSMQDIHKEFEPVRLRICRIMAEGGYLRRVKEGGLALARWYEYLQMIGRPGYPENGSPLVQPTIFPMMEGLSSVAWRDPTQIPATNILESSFEAIRRELARFHASQFVRYPASIIANGQWTVLPLFVFGEDAGPLLYAGNAFPETTRAIKSCPDVCTDLSLADFIFSAHSPGTHLSAHCSWDPFRLRLHLGIRVPPNCRIRVGHETREWTEGKVLAFHDSHEHETWNDGNQTRIVLIVDLWHPDLTAAERRAILACFRKREIRSQLMRTRVPLELQPILERQFATSEKNDPLIREFWTSTSQSMP